MTALKQSLDFTHMLIYKNILCTLPLFTLTNACTSTSLQKKIFQNSFSSHLWYVLLSAAHFHYPFLQNLAISLYMSVCVFLFNFFQRKVSIFLYSKISLKNML